MIRIPNPINEPVKAYAPQSDERVNIQKECERQWRTKVEVPLVINGESLSSKQKSTLSSPHEHGHDLAEVSESEEKHIQDAISGAVKAQKEWASLSLTERSSVFLKAADLLAGPWRDKINAATMISQSKTVHQAEIDAACELIDFLRYNVKFAEQIAEEQPVSSPGMWNRMEQRGLEGFVAAIGPFNFTSISANLAVAPAIMGCSVLWKPAGTAALSSYYCQQLLMAAGLPEGVIQFVPGSAQNFAKAAFSSEHFAGVHFTGSTQTFNSIWRTTAENLDRYKAYPRIVGETGGKDFVFADATADVDSLVCALVRGAFEYQGQKCSAASRAYIPESLWPQVKEKLCEQIESIKMGDPRDFSNFMGAVIDKKAFDKISSYIDHARQSSEAKILAGGQCDGTKGYFIRPTLIQADTPTYKTMVEEIFGPVLSVYVYKDKDLEQTLTIVDQSTPYALTGAIFATDQKRILHLSERLRYAAGNFYINDKPTGAVVGQQPFGGARKSGTNDKAGSKLNLLRWTSPRSIKETFDPPTKYSYPFMTSE
jgi:1-pyrroline-5-carboxylate dehydrogenase